MFLDDCRQRDELTEHKPRGILGIGICWYTFDCCIVTFLDKNILGIPLVAKAPGPSVESDFKTDCGPFLGLPKKREVELNLVHSTSSC